jgi:tetratricopeptide (TPR) repeat protein
MLASLRSLVLLLAWLGFGPGALGYTHAQLGTCLQDAEMPLLTGGRAHLLSSSVVDVVIYFRPGQEFSRMTLKGLGAVEHELAGRSIHWVGVVSDRSPKDDVLAEMKETGLDMPVLVDVGDKLYGTLGVAQLPVTVVCDQEHKLIAYQSFTKVNYSDVIRARLRFFLKEISQAQLDAVLNPPAATTDSDEAAASRRLKLANMLFEAKSYDKALENIDAGLARIPSASAYALRGAILAAQGKCAEAKEAYTQALKLDPQNVRASEGLKGCK